MRYLDSKVRKCGDAAFIVLKVMSKLNFQFVAFIKCKTEIPRDIDGKTIVIYINKCKMSRTVRTNHVKYMVQVSTVL